MEVHRISRRCIAALAMSIGLIGSMVVLTGGSSVAAEEPALCAPGFFSATGTAPCEPALAGFFVDTVGAMTASPCPVGTFNDALAAVSCQLAPAGFFVDTVGATSASPCPTGTTSTVAGATQCAPIVTVTAAQVCSTTLEFVKSSARYTSLSRWSRVLIDSIVRSACSYVGAITPTLTVQRTDLLVAKYNRLVNVLLVGGWLTPSQATTLKGMASGL